MKTKKILAAAFGAALLASCSVPEQGATFTFDPQKEVSGTKFALKDINPELPTDWSGYNYVVLEYKISTSQRFNLGFTTSSGYNELRVMSYVPGAWNRLAIPLKYFTQLPDPANDLAATFNHARYTGWVNLGGKRGPLVDVDSVGVRMRKAIGNQSVTIRNITLSVDDPGDAYLEAKPAVDEFGQSALLEYADKAHSLADLQNDWKLEDALESNSGTLYGYSRYGGYQAARYDQGTGYFRTANVDGKWWFVDPDGYLFLSVGADCVNIGSGGSVRDYDKRANMYAMLPPDSLGRPSFGIWNLVRRYGADYEKQASANVIRRMNRWGLNTIANWSSERIKAMNQVPFLSQLRDLRMDGKLMGLCDVYAPDINKVIDEAVAASVSGNATNPYLIGYFVGNEPAWIGEESRLCQIILDGPERPIQGSLKAYLAKNGDNDGTRRAFIYDSFRQFLLMVNKALDKHDPHHLNLGIRFGNPEELSAELLRMCGECFDVFSFNCYALVPSVKAIDKVLKEAGLPLIIGEYHHGTVDRGLAQSLWQVNSEEQRGVAYRYYTEQGYAHPGLIGTGYFQWADQDLTGRGDGENYNCGFVDVTDRPYKPFVNAVSETSKVLYDVHRGAAQPFNTPPVDARGHEAIPDMW